MRYGATIQWLPCGAGVLRAGPNHKKHGDPFTFTATVEPTDSSMFGEFRNVRVHGGLGTGRFDENLLAQRAGYDALRAAGFTHVHRSRVVGGQEIWRVIPL